VTVAPADRRGPRFVSAAFAPSDARVVLGEEIQSSSQSQISGARRKEG